MTGAGPITFVYADWVSMFPEFARISQAAATGYFGIASTYVQNPSVFIMDPALLTNLLYLTTAHVARLLSAQTNGVSQTGGVEGAPPIVGRINSATEGSVSVQADMPNQPAAAAWWQQTPYGAAAWQMLAPFRTMRHFARPRRIYNPPYWIRGGWYGQS